MITFNQLLELPNKPNSIITRVELSASETRADARYAVTITTRNTNFVAFGTTPELAVSAAVTKLKTYLEDRLEESVKDTQSWSLNLLRLED